jgi:hypothetical protein
VTILYARRPENLPPQRIDQLIQLVEEHRHLALLATSWSILQM